MSVAIGVAKFGLAVLKLMVKLSGGTDTLTVAENAISIAGSGLDCMEKRSRERGLEDMADSITLTCRQILDGAGIDAERQEAIIEDLVRIIERADLTDETILELRAEPATLLRLLERSAAGVLVLYDEDERSLCSRILSHVSLLVTDTALSSVRFGNVAALWQADATDRLIGAVEQVLGGIRSVEKAIRSAGPQEKLYEEKYRNRLISRYENIRLLGADRLTRFESSYPIAVGYVPLELGDRSETVSLPTAVARHRTVWLRGEAGSGKSTLLQWLAVSCAKGAAAEGELGGELCRLLPILIKLRTVEPGSLSLQRAMNDIMVNEDVHSPEGWLSGRLAEGSVAVLIDGVDEVKYSDRETVFTWIEQLRRDYPLIRIVITSRPQVVERIDADLAEISVLPMTPQKVDEFIDYWHAAVLLRNREADAAEIERMKDELRESLEMNDSVRRIASNPLLCAMICALHCKSEKPLSKNKNDLYEDCCRMLLDSRDVRRGVQAYSGVRLSYAEKKTILAHFAFWVMNNGAPEADVSRFERRVAHVLRSFDSDSRQLPPGTVCDYFIERSGLLQRVDRVHIDFIHRSFMEYLAACEISSEDEWGLLASRIDDDSWLETAVLAMNFASAQRAEGFLRGILENGSPRRTVVAASCAANAVSVPEELRREIDERLAALIPPPGDAAAAELAKVGDAAVPFLRFRRCTEEEKLRCLSALSGINSVSSLRMAFSYLTRSATDKVVDVIDGMLGYYSPAELREADASRAVKKYISKKAESGRLLISDSLMRLLGADELRALAPALGKVRHLTLRGYRGGGGEIYEGFTALEELCVVGEFKALCLLRSLPRQPESLTVCARDPEFDPYTLNELPARPKSFALHSCRSLYFSGKDLDFLQDAEKLGLYLYNPFAELLFDDFDRLGALRELALFRRSRSCDWEELLQRFPTLRLRLYAADDELRRFFSRRIQAFRICSFDVDASAQRFAFPYGDLYDILR